MAANRMGRESVNGHGAAGAEEAKAPAASWKIAATLGLLGAWLNSAVYGFRYDWGNQWFELARVNWLRNPSLYPGDAIRSAFANHPTVFWPLVAWLGRWISTEHVLLGFFAATKLLFFLALARLALRHLDGGRQRWWLAAAIVAGVAISPVLNELTPLGHSDVLNAIQTHTSLAMALLVWAAVFLVEERWMTAAMLAAATVYIDGLFFAYMLAAFAVFAVADWPRHRRRIVAAALAGAAISLPWLLAFPGAFASRFPPGYVDALLTFYPFHLRLAGHEPYELAEGAGLVAAAAAMAWMARLRGIAPARRMEWLTWAFLIPLGAGSVAGALRLTPTLARLQLLRVDSFFDLFAILLIQIYGARLLTERAAARSGWRVAVGLPAILLPVAGELALVWAVLLALCVWGLSSRLRRASVDQDKFPARKARQWTRGPAVALGVGVAAALLLSWNQAGPPNRWSRIWNPVTPMTAEESDWEAAQLWAKEHTARDAAFLVPIYPSGFRVLSERSAWGEWEDGAACYFFPPFASRYKERMTALGFPWGHWVHTSEMKEIYRKRSWPELLEIARRNRLDYIVVFRGADTGRRPVYANGHFEIYGVTP